METREELLSGLKEAVYILEQLSGIQQRLNQIRSQYKNQLAHKKFGLLAKIVLGFFILGCLGSLTSGSMSTVVTQVIFTAGVYFVMKMYYQSKNKSIDQQNEQIAAENQNLSAREQDVIDELRNMQMVYQEKMSAWYPESYCSVDAAEFFLDAIKNYRADNIKEAINLYETTLHQRRVEDNQKQALKQQKLNNLLSAGNLFVQGAQLGEMGRQTAEAQQANKTLSDIRTHLRGY